MKTNKLSKAIQKIKENKTLKNVLFINILLFTIWLPISITFNLVNQHLFFNILYSITTLAILIVIPGFNITLILQILLNKKISFIETTTLSVLFFLTINPLLLLLISISTKFTAATPIALSLISFFALIIILYLNKTKQLEYINWIKPISQLNIKKTYKSPIIYTIIFYLLIIFIIVAAYYPLPDLDPYYWLNLYQISFSSNEFSLQDPTYRPLFLTLIYTLNKTVQIDSYLIFKYVLPFLFILILAPLFLLIKNLKNKENQILFLLLPLITASSLLYFLTPFSQIIFTIICFFFVFLLLTSNLNKEKKYLYYIAGLSIGIATFYHEFSVILFLIWILITILKERKNLIQTIQNNKASSFLLITLIISHTYSYILHSIQFILYWSKTFLSIIFKIQTNFLFPFKYKNIDGISMGWESASGLIKYYAYYVGPFIFFLILLITIKLLVNKQFKKYFKEKIKEKEILVLLLIFLLMFAISEIFPRFFNFALLPERAWTLGSIFFIVMPFILFTFIKKRNNVLTLILILLTTISLIGSIHINNLKKYVITQPQIESANLIKKNLPSNRIVLSNNHKYLLRYFSNSDTISVPYEFYTQNQNFIQSIIPIIEEKKQRKFTNFRNNITITLNTSSDYDELINQLKESADQTKNEKNLKKSGSIIETQNKEYYIYYSKIHPKNPYIQRPYTNLVTTNDQLIFDQSPNIFKKVYSDNENEIYIWKILIKF